MATFPLGSNGSSRLCKASSRPRPVLVSTSHFFTAGALTPPSNPAAMFVSELFRYTVDPS
jgi:hypothetical protein